MMIPPTCVTTSGDGIEIRDCTLESVQLGGGRGHVIEDNEIDGGNVWAFGCNEITIRRNRQHGLRWGVGLDLIGGSGHVIEDNDVSDDLCGIRLTGASGEPGDRQPRAHPVVGRPPPRAAPSARARDNEVDRTMRAQCVEGGSREHGRRATWPAAATPRCWSSRARVTRWSADNRAEDCRLDTLVWEST